ncbi:amidohydrolase family protein [Photobacterium sp. ZSDE20]|uniref:Amidohydrolase family protein n=1 Tax=Photobacterium pectinilyticum TaxID=2906793 RepID=A0ABT1N996_9GAMM|nr:amidohydrolase family protein [Photobacterium sp. ZSDE20]MCQ1061296.1 amidohydrolase family protein [Photobacterium sp. ZSDE20]MDD1829849.1 amidohydrolase family protein [Photobacterium sp. ZSDE20]
MFDIILKNGTVYDGTGSTPFIADVAIYEGRIVGIGGFTEAIDVIDVTGLAVSPGFIDMHTHSDFTLLVNGNAESQVHQGVTTEVIGQCGFSSAPVSCVEDAKAMSIGYINDSVDISWRSFGDYLSKLESSELGVNVAAFVGHGTVYKLVMGDNGNALPSDAQLAEMAQTLEECFEQGAIGMSSGLEYYPGRMTSPEHLVPLCEVVARYNGLYATHVRNRDLHYDLGFIEAISTARVSGARLQISHIQPKFGAPKHAMRHTLDMIAVAKEHGVEVGFDIIPHDWSHTGVMQILPSWALEGGSERLRERLRNPTQRALIKQNPTPMWKLVVAEQWEKIVLLYSVENVDLIGYNFAQISEIRQSSPYDCVLDLLLEEKDIDALQWTSQSFCDDDIELCLQQQECGVISDTLALAPYGKLKDHIGSLSGYGWAARFLQVYVHNRKVLTLSQAINKLTLLPAEQLRLKDRGRIAVGQYADIAIFDPSDIRSNCSISNPRKYSSGIAHVIVNGRFSLKDGERTNTNNGRVLRRESSRS